MSENATHPNVLPGSESTMGLLRLAVLSALDKHAATLPSRLRAIYVDDAPAVYNGPGHGVVPHAVAATVDLVTALGIARHCGRHA